MAWRYRRSKSFGPFRLTATRSGLGLSVGGPFGRISVNTRGQVRETTRIPGIGIYQTQQIANLGSSGRSKQTYQPHPVASSRPAPHPAAAPAPARTGPRAGTPITWAVLTGLFGIVLPVILPPDGGGSASMLFGILCAIFFVITFITYLVRRYRYSRVVLPEPVPMVPASTSVSAPVAAPLSTQELSDVVTNALAAPATQDPGPAVSVEALDATGGHPLLDPTAPDVVSARLVGLTNTVTSVADLIHLQPGEDGLRHGVHEGMLIPTGAQWHAFCLVHPEDNPAATPPHPATAAALHVGRLGARDARRYEHLFNSHPVTISLFIETTSGLERIEARFLNRPVQVDEAIGAQDAPVAASTPTAPEPASQTLAPAAWYTDPSDETKWRWWDGRQWTTYTAPRIGSAS